MIRRWLLPQIRPILPLVLCALMVAAPAALAQDATTQERLDRLERDLSMLQRQVYRGDNAGPGPSEGGNLAVDTQIRMDRLEQQMRDLTGKVEDETNQVEQLRQRLEQINSDIDTRFSQLGQGQAAAEPAPPPRPGRRPATLPGEAMAPPPTNPTSFEPYGDRMPADAAAPPPDIPPSSGTLTPPGLGAGTPAEPPPSTPQPASAAAGGLRPPGAGMLPSGSVLAQYNSAFGLLRHADYSAAEEALQAFVAQHPGHPLAGNAQYWLGESYYARGKYIEAASAFAEGYKRYPKGPKAADDLLQLASALGRANQKQNACLALGQLDHDFPHPGSAVRERALAEKKRLGC